MIMVSHLMKYLSRFSSFFFLLILYADVCISEDKVKNENNMTVSFVGVVNPISRYNLTPMSSGYVKNIYFAQGGIVEKDSLLVQLNDDYLQIKKRKIEKEINLSAINLKRIERKIERSFKLFKENHINAEEYESLQFEISTAEEQLEISKIQLELCIEEIKRKKIYTPISGRIGVTSLQVGEYIESDSVEVFGEVINDSAVYIDFEISQREFYKIKEYLDSMVMSEDQYIIFSDSEAGINNKAYIVAYDSEFSSRNTIRVRAKADNKDGSLIAGTYLTVKMEVKYTEFTSL